MPNWCNNKIIIKGPKKSIDQIKKLIKNSDEGVFATLVGNPPSRSSEQKYWGTKWDIDPDVFKLSYKGNTIKLYPETAWTPPIEFLIKLCKKFKVDAEITYSEHGDNFSGICKIKKGRVVLDEEYEYLEGLYLFDTINFWDEVEYQLEEFENEDGSKIGKDDVVSMFPFASKKDHDKLKKMIK